MHSGRCAGASWTERLHSAGLAGGNLDDWHLDELDVHTLAGGASSHGAPVAPRLPDYIDGHFAGPGGTSFLPDHRGGHAAQSYGGPVLPEYASGHAAPCGRGMPSLY